MLYMECSRGQAECSDTQFEEIGAFCGKLWDSVVEWGHVSGKGREREMGSDWGRAGSWSGGRGECVGGCFRRVDGWKKRDLGRSARL